jgi:50S ribosomal subunit-associated GTPase HflX
MFSTVSPKTRRFRNSRVLLTDTVGFIQDIPTQLIEAFKSTLEEITDTDHIMLIVDISEQIPIIEKKIRTCLQTIDQLIIERYRLDDKSKSLSPPQIKRPNYHIVFNKIDLEPEYNYKVTRILDTYADELTAHGPFSIYKISCKTKQGLESIIDMLLGKGLLIE